MATLGDGKGPCVALRADMDALPIHEEADIPFRSEVDGKMHACGHDCHTAMLLGAARLLKAHEAELRGTVKLIFQPAEEMGAGAERMCQGGVLKKPKVERIFGLHVSPAMTTGTVAGKAGMILAAGGAFKITVKGKGGHGALPHLTIDPITCAAKIVVELQTIVSRETNPFSPTEDFAFYQQRIPGCFAFPGVSDPVWETRHGVHHPKFRVDEAALPIGTAWHVAMAMGSLAETRA